MSCRVGSLGLGSAGRPVSPYSTCHVTCSRWSKSTKMANITPLHIIHPIWSAPPTKTTYRCDFLMNKTYSASRVCRYFDQYYFLILNMCYHPPRHVPGYKFEHLFLELFNCTGDHLLQVKCTTVLEVEIPECHIEISNPNSYSPVSYKSAQDVRGMSLHQL